MLPFKRILCPTDFSEPAFTALKRAEELARHFAAELIVAHVIPTLPGPLSGPDHHGAARGGAVSHRMHGCVSAGHGP